jgi:hypothetical protein
MKRMGFLLILAVLTAPLGEAVPNPDDVEFRIRFVTNRVAYHTGESIEVELSYASRVEKKYRGTWTRPRPELGTVTLQISPMDGVVDLRSLTRGWSGSSISGQSDLGSEPRIEQLDLRNWYQFQRAGHFSLTITSKCISRMKDADEGGGEEHLILESNSLEFEIMPADPAWNAAEFADIERVLDYSTDPQERYSALHRLAILDSPASIQKLVKLYLSQGPQGESTGFVYRGLNYSSQTDLLIGLLESSLSDPKANPRGVGADLLAELQVRRDLGAFPPLTGDLQEQKEREQKIEKRNKAYEMYFAKTNALLLESMARRTGPERTTAIYEAWNNAERQNAGKPGGSETLARLRTQVLVSVQELQPGQKMQFLYSEWPILSHQQLLPVIESVANNRREDAIGLRDQAYQFWCQDWPKECGAALLAEATRPGTQISPATVLLLSEAEHPELDALLEAELQPKEPNAPQDSMKTQILGAVVLRAGSRKLQTKVDAYLDRLTSYQGYDCEIQGYLLGYLFRFAVADASKRTLALAQGEKSQCGGDILRMLHRVRYSDDQISVATKALYSPNLWAAGNAAMFLGAHGPASVQEDLWRRLDAVREKWVERTAELRAAETRVTDSGIAGQTAQLEQELVSGLVNAINWKLTTGERERLREGCLTDRCRDIADGKMSFGF